MINNEKKTININFCGFWEGFCPEKFFIYEILKERYNVIISNEPDYIFVSVFDYDYKFCGNKGVRIFYSGENVAPDFALFDYAIGFDNIIFSDRYFRYPMAYSDRRLGIKAETKHLDVTKDSLNEKKYFCSFMYSHEGIPERTQLFNMLSNYKRVESVGKYLRNSDIVVPYDEDNSSKIAFQSQAKFVLAVENISYPGYATEKLLHAFASKSIPIYYGDPEIGKEFNSKAFINCHEYDSFNDVVRAVVKIDRDDELYLEMLRQPAFLGQGYVEEKYEQFKQFLYHIFEQEYQGAFRRPLGGIVCDREQVMEKFSFFKAEYFKMQNKKLINRIKRKLI